MGTKLFVLQINFPSDTLPRLIHVSRFPQCHVQTEFVYLVHHSPLICIDGDEIELLALCRDQI